VCWQDCLIQSALSRALREKLSVDQLVENSPPVTKSEVLPPCSQDYAPEQDELKLHSYSVS